jgi:membrane-associated phospholipid phosphatase
MSARTAGLVLLGSLALAPAARADPPAPLRWEPAQDVSLTVAAAALWVGTELGSDHLAPARCRICGGNALDDRVRDALVVSSPDRARRASDVLAFGAIPLAVAAEDILAARAGGDARAALVDAGIVLQAVAITADLTQLAKFTTGRLRPEARFAGPGHTPSRDDNLSFFSGHTSIAFAFVASAASVASLRGYATEPWIWGLGLPLAGGVGVLRMAGDAHYLTDVVAGAAVGTAVGVLVPRLLHPREKVDRPAAPSIALVPYPVGLSGTF